MGEAKRKKDAGWSFPKTDRVIQSKVEAGRYTAEMTLGLGGAFTCEWSPKFPSDIRPFELALYRKARNELIQKAVTELGVTAMLVEL